MKKLTISIVSYNSGEYFLKCLTSLQKVSKELDFDVVVVDNHSTDGSLSIAKEKFPEFKFISNKENYGFGKAQNMALRQARTPYVLTLNSDCEVPPGTLGFMCDYMDKNPHIGISTCRVEKADGTLDLASHRSFPTPWQSFLYLFFKRDKSYHMRGSDMTKPHEIDSAVGAFMFIRKSVLDEVGYFDEDYFLYAEDIDLCYRVKQAGYKIFYLPQVKAVHIKGASSGIKEHSRAQSRADDETKKLALNHFYDTMKIFYKKHYENKYPFFVNWAAYLAIDLKWFMARRKKSV